MFPSYTGNGKRPEGARRGVGEDGKRGGGGGDHHDVSTWRCGGGKRFSAELCIDVHAVRFDAARSRARVRERERQRRENERTREREKEAKEGGGGNVASSSRGVWLGAARGYGRAARSRVEALVFNGIFETSVESSTIYDMWSSVESCTLTKFPVHSTCWILPGTCIISIGRAELVSMPPQADGGGLAGYVPSTPCGWHVTPRTHTHTHTHRH